MSDSSPEAVKGPQPALEQLPNLAIAKAEWTRLAQLGGNVFGTWDWANCWYKHLGAGARLALAVARRPDGEAVAILPIYVARERPVRLTRFVGAGLSDELGPVCAPPDVRFAGAALRHHIDETLGKAGLFLGERLRDEGPLRSTLDATTVLRAASPVLEIEGGTFDEFLASRSRNLREQVRRRERKLAREENLSYRLTQDPDQLDGDMEILMRLHAARWADGQSRVFDGPRAQFHLDFARRALENGWLRLWTMELRGRPVASWYGLRFGGAETYYQAGRDPAYGSMNVGFVLLCHTIRCAFEDGMRCYRFGSGDEAYKSRFADDGPGLRTVAIATGVRGRMSLLAMRAALRMPNRARNHLLQLGVRRSNVD